MADLIGTHHIALTVRDAQASRRWYTEVLGFVELFAEASAERRAFVLTYPGGGPSVGVVEHRGSDGDNFDPGRLGLDHVAFTVRTRDDMERWAERLSAAAVEHSGVIDVPPGAILNFKDPDGIALALFWDRPPAAEG